MEIDRKIEKSIESCAPCLVDLAGKLHENPELAMNEYDACRRQVKLLKSWGFKVESPYAGLDTAFRAELGSGKPVFAILSEYDALPEIGHACGHNLIAGVALGAGKALAEIVQSEKLSGTILVLGTPGEEGRGGKIKMLNHQAFDDVEVAIMAHPSYRTTIWKGSLGIERYDVSYTGLAAHAATAPEQGKNALDGVMLLFAGVNAWRQHLPEDSRIHGIVTSGGVAPNIVPEHASCRFYIRANDAATQTMMQERFRQIAEGAALMSDTELEIIPPTLGEKYLPGRPNEILNQAYYQISSELGMNPVVPERGGRGSSDFSDVSQRLPGTHVYFGVVENGEEVPLHSAKFAVAAGSGYAMAQMLKTAQVLARTGYRYMSSADFREQVKAEFSQAD